MSTTFSGPLTIITNPVGVGRPQIYEHFSAQPEALIIETDPFRHSPGLQYRIETLIAEVSQLKVAVESLTALVAAQKRPADLQQQTKPRRSRVTDAHAKTLIKAFFEKRHGQTIYPSDVADELRIDYDRASHLIAELEADGKIAKV
nr:hypothetical protein [uncultured Rhodopila sp.]